MAERYFRKYVRINIINNKSMPDKKVAIYQFDRGLILCFKLVGYDYQLTNIDRGVENMEDCYASITLITPAGEELFYDNIPVKSDVVEFAITEDITDDFNEIGTHKLQIHINNELSPGDYSVFSIPPFDFTVLKRIGNIRQEGEIASDIVDADGYVLIDADGYVMLEGEENIA